MRRNFSKSSGFSLIELMIVVAIIGLLAAVAMPAYFKHILRVRQSTCVQNLIDVKTAQEKYYALFDTYASTGTLETGVDVFASYVNFSASNTSMCVFNITGGTTSFTARLWGDLDRDGFATDCWSISSTSAQPATTGGVGCVVNGEGFSFSTLGNLL